MISNGRPSSAAAWLRRVIDAALLLVCLNSVLLACLVRAPAWMIVVGALLLLAWFALLSIRPISPQAPTRRTRSLAAGGELILLAAGGLVAELALYLCFTVRLRAHVGSWPLVANAAVGLVLMGALVCNGVVRIVAASRRAGAGQGAAVAALAWIPIVGLVALIRFRHAAMQEYDFVIAGIRRDQERKDAQICRSRYPIVMVHGIFFRDWKHFNYWGRIPAALERNGARVFYGRQQSSNSIEASAAQLRDAIVALCDETGCEKVNIIAHSKGGLDARYAISRLGIASQVASLTTINTPHRGTVLAQRLITLTPERMALAVGRRYEALFARLGDDEPDFLAGITGLTPAACALLNGQLPDDDRVVYLSCGSAMKTARSAPFPLSLGHRLMSPLAGENDGLVDVPSMAWGELRTIARGTKRPGVSHGDMIDLLRRDIPGFDVCEFYVQLVADLARRGL